MEREQVREWVHASGCAHDAGGYTFLLDPALKPDERAALLASAAKLPETTLRDGWLCIPTGGTSGGAKFARHDERTLSAAVNGFCAHFELKQVNAVGVLPAFHVSGLMARLRCAATGGEHVAWDWKRLEAGERPRRGAGDWVLSLVPTQLQRLMLSPDAVEWMRGFKIIFIGGGPMWSDLERDARAAQLPLSLSYGMTETAAMVAALRPAEFLAGNGSSGRPMPHAKITVSEEGVITIAGESVFRGYFPHTASAREFVTEDLGRFDDEGYLHINGRRDAVIITGGKKVNPSVVEEVLRSTGRFADVAVVGVPDAEWGEVVVACYLVGGGGSGWEAGGEKAIRNQLAKHERPKRFMAIPAKDWPRNAQGKLNRKVLRELATGKSRS